MNKEILKERERIKKKFDELLERLIARRQDLKHNRSRSIIRIAEIKRLQENLIFWIDNPSYVRKIVKKVMKT